jgi:hypothetical protein
LKELEVAAYLDRRLPTVDRDRIEDHLAGCRECREEVMEARRLLAQARRPRRLALAGGLLAAAAALVLLVRPAMLDPDGRGDDERPRVDGATPALVAYGPTGEVSLSGLRFVWGPVPAAATYRLTLSGADGVPLWTASTADTALALADSIRLGPGRTYFWMADALLTDGTTRSTGLREFRPMR